MTLVEKAMLGFVVIFLTSVLWPSLPSISLIAFLLLALLFTLRYKLSAYILGALFGFLWASMVGYYYTTWQLDQRYFNQNLIVEGVVTSIVPPNTNTLKQHGDENTRVNTPFITPYVFSFSVNKIGAEKSFFTPIIRVSWYSPTFMITQGQRLRLFVRLKAPVALANREGFNYQKWLASKNIVATAYVKNSPSNLILNADTSLRQNLVNNITLSDLEHEKWLRALMYGDRSGLNDKDWALMQSTGTAHLFAISGMHLSIVFAFSLYLSKSLRYLISLCYMHTQVNSRALSWSFATICCVLYAWLSGFEVPVLRALVSVVMLTVLILINKHWRLRSTTLVLLTTFFLLFPFAHLGLSFWFSFIAVMLIWFYLWRFKIHRNATKLQTCVYALKLQLFLSLATLPMIVVSFDTLPVVSFVANIVMTPLVSFILLPLCLLAAVIAVIGYQLDSLLILINKLFDYAIIFLTLINQWQALDVSSFHYPMGQLALLLLTVLLLVLPYWYQKRRCLIVLVLLNLLMCLPSTNYWQSSASPWYVHVFDVGQGSAIVIEANNAFIIYDTGPSFRGDFSMANAVLLPFFKSKGMPSIDKLILSHLDNDHAGGKMALMNALFVEKLITPKNACVQGSSFGWQGLTIDFLWPKTPQTGDENNHSCVIKITDSGGHSILLTGDIEAPAEKRLIDDYKNTDMLRSTILTAPHHGSSTSSSEAFVNATRPEYIVFSAGYNNRWGFPAASVMQRYLKHGSALYNTGNDGQIRFTIYPDKIEVSRYRIDEYQRWFFATY